MPGLPSVDQRGAQVGTGGGVDAAGRDEAVFLSPQEFGFPMGAIGFLFDLGQCVGNATANVMYIGFLALGVFLDQNFTGNFLLRQRCKLWRCRNVCQRKLFGNFAHQGLLYKTRVDWVIYLRMLQSYYI